VNLIHGYSVAYLLDAQQNIAAAYKIWLDSSWIPWSCKP
jgi:hypothetical protein